MHINRLSLINSLTSMINENNQDDAYFTLAHYFLEHYHELSDLNIYEVADECFVSRSSVRRFCQAIGYENFKDLKNQFREYDDQLHYFMANVDREHYRAWLTNEIIEMMKEMDQRMETEEVEVIVDRIHSSRHVVFLTSDTSTMSVKEFQRSMVLCGKIIRIVSDTYQDNDLLQVLDERDYLITVSATGQFAKAASDIVQSSRAFKALVTVNREEALKQPYQQVYHLSARDHSMEKSVYGKYGIDYMLDILYAAYVRKYTKKGE